MRNHAMRFSIPKKREKYLVLSQQRAKLLRRLGRRERETDRQTDRQTDRYTETKRKEKRKGKGEKRIGKKR